MYIIYMYILYIIYYIYFNPFAWIKGQKSYDNANNCYHYIIIAVKIPMCCLGEDLACGESAGVWIHSSLTV